MSWGGVGRSTGFRSVPSGKGISCARTALALGLRVRAHAFVGEDDLKDFSARLEDEGLDHHLVTVPGRTRHNLTLIDGTGERVAAHFVAPGFSLEDPAPTALLLERLLDDIVPGDVVTLNGSTPSGLPDTTWSRFARDALGQGARVLGLPRNADSAGVDSLQTQRRGDPGASRDRGRSTGRPDTHGP